MKRLLLFCYISLIIAMVIATFVERLHGTSVATEFIYHNPLFFVGWGLCALLMTLTLLGRRSWRRPSSALLHTSFIVILSGAAISFTTSKKGYLYLREGMTSSQFVEQETQKLMDMPFTLQLNNFKVEHYPGTQAPANYISEMTCFANALKDTSHITVAMNSVFAHDGYRFYISSFDADEGGARFIVNYDPWGIAVTYFGYFVFVCSMLMLMLKRKGTWRRLLHHPQLHRTMFLVGFILTSALSVQAEHLKVITRATADSLSKTQVIYHNRVALYNTMATDFVKKIAGTTNFQGLTPEQVVGSCTKYPEDWKHTHVIEVKDPSLQRMLGCMHAPYVSYDTWTKWIKNNADGLKDCPQKAIDEITEKVAIMDMLMNGTWIKPIPTDGTVKPLNTMSVHAELLYNKVSFSKILFIFNLMLGILSFLWFVLQVKAYTPNEEKWHKRTDRFFKLALWLSLTLQTFHYALRWYIGGRIPLSNGFETMLFLSLCLLTLAWLLHRRIPIALSFGFLLSGCTLLVAHLGQLNPHITPLMPVLVSPWLSIHVSCIIMAYALLGFIMLNGILGLCLARDGVRLMLFSKLLLYPAVFLLGTGIFIGAVWANESWGRYWAWDPKEVWALITFMIYATALHTEQLPRFKSPKVFHAFMVVAFASVIMTYFGVNFILGGLHSYVE